MDRAKGYCLHSPYEIEKCVTMKHVIGNIIQKSYKLHGLKGKYDRTKIFHFMKYINEIRKIERMRAIVNMCMRDRRKM